MNTKQDGCSGFFNTWVQWDFKLDGWRTFLVWRLFKLEDLCNNHDTTCSSGTFFKELRKNRVVGGLLIGSIASLACWVKYPKHMRNRI